MDHNVLWPPSWRIKAVLGAVFKAAQFSTWKWGIPQSFLTTNWLSCTCCWRIINELKCHLVRLSVRSSNVCTVRFNKESPFGFVLALPLCLLLHVLSAAMDFMCCYITNESMLHICLADTGARCSCTDDRKTSHNCSVWLTKHCSSLNSELSAAFVSEKKKKKQFLILACGELCAETMTMSLVISILWMSMPSVLSWSCVSN